MCPRSPARLGRAALSPHGHIVSSVWEELREVLCQTRVRPPVIGAREETLPGDGLRPARKGAQLGNRSPANGYPNSFARLDATQHAAHIVAKVSRWNVWHDRSVAVLLQTTFRQSSGWAFVPCNEACRRVRMEDHCVGELAERQPHELARRDGHLGTSYGIRVNGRIRFLFDERLIDGEPDRTGVER